MSRRRRARVESLWVWELGFSGVRGGGWGCLDGCNLWGFCAKVWGSYIPVKANAVRAL